MKTLKLILAAFVLISFCQMNGQSKKQDLYRTKKGERYHKKDCKIIKGRNTLKISLKDAKKKGMQPCRVCHPLKKKGVVTEKKSIHKTKIPAKKSVAVRCMGITQKGLQCKRMTKSSDGTCWQHR